VQHGGLALGGIGAGLLVEFAPAPTQLIYWCWWCCSCWLCSRCGSDLSS
jgi:hypothetical protein